MKYFLGIDFGGSSSKATLIDEKGTLVAENSVEYPTLYPQLGFCEQDPADWCDALCRNTRALLGESGIAPQEIAAVAIDSATHTWLGTDEQFRPLMHAIHWTDSRSRQESADLRQAYSEEIFRLTYHKPDTIWTMPQMAWIRTHEPEIFSKIRHIFFEKDYIRYFLTKVYCTDFIEAQGSMLFDCSAMTWSDSLCQMVGIRPEILPPLVSPTDVIGTVTAEAAVLTGLAAGTPVICGTTDTVMEVFASSAVSEGNTTVKLATAGRICVITSRPFPDRDLVNYSHIVSGLWYPGSATKAAASSLRWYRDTFGGDYASLYEEAASVTPGCEGLVYHPYINGELTPYADPDLCGSFIGIRSTHTHAHFTRAVMEGVAFSLMASKQKLISLGTPISQQATLIGGGARSKTWGQIVSDCLNMELDVTVSSDSSLGSAMLAALSCRAFATPQEAVTACIHVRDHIIPNAQNHELYCRLFMEYEQIHDALAPIYAARHP